MPVISPGPMSVVATKSGIHVTGCRWSSSADAGDGGYQELNQHSVGGTTVRWSVETLCFFDRGAP